MADTERIALRAKIKEITSRCKQHHLQMADTERIALRTKNKREIFIGTNSELQLWMEESSWEQKQASTYRWRWQGQPSKPTGIPSRTNDAGSPRTMLFSTACLEPADSPLGFNTLVCSGIHKKKRCIWTWSLESADSFFWEKSKGGSGGWDRNEEWRLIVRSGEDF